MFLPGMSRDQEPLYGGCTGSSSVNVAPLPSPSLCARQRSAQLRRRQRAAVQAEAVAVFAGRKAMIENARQVFRRNPNAIVNDGNADPLITPGDLEPDLLVLPPRFVTGILGIADHIDQNLEHLVFFSVSSGTSLYSRTSAISCRVSAPAFMRRASSTRSVTLTVSTTPETLA